MFAIELSDRQLHWTLATTEIRFANEDARIRGLVRSAAIALHESSGFAAGKPNDELWHRTYEAMERLVCEIEPLAGWNDPCVTRLRSFLEENDDLREAYRYSCNT